VTADDGKGDTFDQNFTYTIGDGTAIPSVTTPLSPAAGTDTVTGLDPNTDDATGGSSTESGVVETVDESINEQVVVNQTGTNENIGNVDNVDTVPASVLGETVSDNFDASGSVLDAVEQATINESNEIDIFSDENESQLGENDFEGVKGFSVSFELAEISETSALPLNSLFPMRIEMDDEDESDSKPKESDQLVIRSLVEERTLYVEVNYIVISNPDLQTSSFKVTLANGDPLPSWLRIDDRGALVSGEPPVDIQDLQLRVEVNLTDGTNLIRYVSVDTFTGEIVAMQDTGDSIIAGTQTFSNQISSATNEFELAKNELTTALDE
jgi:hypothetical protein